MDDIRLLHFNSKYRLLSSGSFGALATENSYFTENGGLRKGEL